MDLSTLRSEIDRIDKEMIILLNKRLGIALQIGKLKTEMNLPVFNKKREQEIIEKLTSQNPGPLTDNQITHIFHTIMDICRNAQFQSRKD